MPAARTQCLHYNYAVPKSASLLAVAAFMLAGCSWQASSLGGATPTLFVITSTLPPTPIPSITFTPVPPSPSPTVVPVVGQTTTQVNVRGEPSATATQLGILAPFVRVQIVGRDAGGDWYLILYSAAPGGTGWVTAQYITAQNTDTIPVVGAPAETATAPEETGTPAASGTIIQQLNVRKGPGADFDIVGMLNAKDTASLLGKDPSGTWLQIRYASGPDGKGWIAAQFVQAESIDALPTVGGDAAVTGTPAASSTPLPATATPLTALQDNDSAEAPGANAVLAPTAARSLIYSSDLSSPKGDAQDFVGFSLSEAEVLLSLSCVGNGSVRTSLWSNGAPVAAWPGLSCGDARSLALEGGKPYLLELSIAPGQASQAYVHYTIRIEQLN